MLQPFQRGEPPFYIGHIRRGVELLRANPGALLLFSGGSTRSEAGHRWSEAGTYLAIAKHFGWWCRTAEESRALETRVAMEDFSRDSFENLLFSLGRFQQLTGRYPRAVTLVSWAFKRERFALHRAAIRFPAERFHFTGVNNPLDVASALRGEAATLEQFKESRYGQAGWLAEKRAERNPLHRRHHFRECPGLAEFFDFIEASGNQQKEYPATLPWSA